MIKIIHKISWLRLFKKNITEKKNKYFVVILYPNIEEEKQFAHIK